MGAQGEVETVEDVIAQMRLLLKAVPPRPSPNQVEVAKQAIRDEERALESRLDELFSQPCPPAVPPRVFRALQEMHESVIRIQSEVKKQDHSFTLQLEEKHQNFEDLIRKAESALPQGKAFQALPQIVSDGPQRQQQPPEEQMQQLLRRSASGPLSTIKEDAAVTRAGFLDSLQQHPSPKVKSSKYEPEAGGLMARTRDEGRKLFESKATPEVLTTAAAPISTTKGKEDGTVVPLSKEDEEMLGARWPPNLLTILEAAENEGKQPETLDFSNGGYTWIPESIGILVNLTSLDLSGNQLQGLPEAIGLLTGLIDLNLEANLLKSLPDSLGLLINLERLNVEKNSIEELPWTIGKCTSLVELRADFNQLKALPEAVGQLKNLKVLSVHLNCLKTLPTTMSSLSSLTELYVHFNQLETLPENLCSVTTLQKLDASSNFADFRSLPQSIGKLQGLRDLDLSFNHLSVLPDSFTQLTNLRRLKLDGNPWRIPPLEVVAQGHQAILEYMAKYKEKEEEEKKVKETGGWNFFGPAIQLIAAMDGERRELKWWSRSHRLIRNAQLQKDFRVREFAEEEHTVTLPRVYDVRKYLVSRLL
ncbi:hypothetical protein R1sor_015844 [Riccia sorocarpa]|uniref:Leucine-rich repeat-containing protein n=1 Tax=Riccia sorocarpa TaxID=122646 RepID=A0ABD3HDC4_9MARC